MVSRKILFTLAVAGMCLMLVAGCTPHKQTQRPMPLLTCEDALSEGPSNLSADDIERILDEAADGNQMAECWRPLIKECLDENIAIPFNHLARAVNEFNAMKTKNYFHKAVFRYFSTIDQGKATYGSADRKLLTAYCRQVISNATSSRDPNLQNAELLARRLDPDLYKRLFQ